MSSPITVITVRMGKPPKLFNRERPPAEFVEQRLRKTKDPGPVWASLIGEALKKGEQSEGRAFRGAAPLELRRRAQSAGEKARRVSLDLLGAGTPLREGGQGIVEYLDGTQQTIRTR